MERRTPAANPPSAEEKRARPAAAEGIVSLYAARLAALPAKSAPDFQSARVIPFGRGSEPPTPIARIRRRPA